MSEPRARHREREGERGGEVGGAVSGGSGGGRSSSQEPHSRTWMVEHDSTFRKVGKKKKKTKMLNCELDNI
jgi:hypothetical protein